MQTTETVTPSDIELDQKKNDQLAVNKDKKRSSKNDDEKPPPYHRLHEENQYSDLQFQEQQVKVPVYAIILAIALFLIGSVMIILGALMLTGRIETQYSDRTWPLILVGSLVFLPGFYHLRIAYWAWKGDRNFSFSDIPDLDCINFRLKMGNICSWCFKTEDDSQMNNNADNHSEIINSQRQSSTSKVNDRTPLLSKSGNHNNHSITPILQNSQSNGEVLPATQLLQPPVINETRTETKTINETAENKMASIVEGMLSKLIDVSNSGSNMHQTNTNTNGLNTENDYLRQLLTTSLSSTKILAIPDAGLNNLPSLLSGRPISSDICHFVAHTAGELSSLLINEIKIIHKEQLVVVFE
ncbi:unnamed protein product [Rotaria sp. Silwood1]|nr:unnamed protein product [Rotaria sp. Silwood1]CAF0970785.1 unnamed protein product [Rotaria sp. Silwood1]